MHRIIRVLLALIFFLLGCIGLLLPIIPQIPFFILSALLLAGASSAFRSWISSTAFYRKHIQPRIPNSRILQFLIGNSE